MLGKVYLAGPIRGLTYKECTSWRDYAIKELAKYGIIGVSPLRCKENLDNGEIILEQQKGMPLTSERGVITRDRWDVVQNCDIFLANLLGAKEVSIGTMIEYAWADIARKPIITVIEPQGNVHDHLMIREMTGFRVGRLEEGLYIARTILNP